MFVMHVHVYTILYAALQENNSGFLTCTHAHAIIVYCSVHFRVHVLCSHVYVLCDYRICFVQGGGYDEKELCRSRFSS